MKKYILIPLLCLYTFSYGQTFKKDSLISKFDIGIYPNIYYVNQLTEINSDEFVNLFSCELRPYFAYNVYNNIFLGCNISYEFIASDFYEKENFRDLGVFVRYIIPYTGNKKLSKKIHLYFECGYYKTNYIMVGETINIFKYKSIDIYEDFRTSNDLAYSKISIPIGLTFNVTNKLYIDLNWQYVKYVDGGTKRGFMCGLGYNIGKKIIK